MILILGINFRRIFLLVFAIGVVAVGLADVVRRLVAVSPKCPRIS